MHFKLLSPRSEKIEFDIENDIVTFDLLRQTLIERFNFSNLTNYTFYHDKNLITRSTKFTESSLDENKTIVIVYISKSQFPDLTFPKSDFEFPVDFSILNSNETPFPPNACPKYYHNSNTGISSFVEDAIEQAASVPFLFQIVNHALQDLDFATNINANNERAARNNSRLNLFNANVHPEEEQTLEDGDENEDEAYDDEEDFADDIDEIMEMKENYEENMTDEQKKCVDKFVDMGFDKNLVTPLLFMIGDEEKTMQFLQKAFDEM